ncbi:MAG TPA: hypothetical protein VES88_12495 [Gemmatimonadaceae bacterium]|nr:hypothetical protein [Gemmatimonadaceae bacterium]
MNESSTSSKIDKSDERNGSPTQHLELRRDREKAAPTAPTPEIGTPTVSEQPAVPEKLRPPNAIYLIEREAIEFRRQYWEGRFKSEKAPRDAALAALDSKTLQSASGDAAPSPESREAESVNRSRDRDVSTRERLAKYDRPPASSQKETAHPWIRQVGSWAGSLFRGEH